MATSLGDLRIHLLGHAPAPFKAPNGAYYAVAGYAVGGDDNISVYKATDPNSSWTEQDTSNRPAIANTGESLNAVDAVMEGETIHILFVSDEGETVYSPFDTSNDTYGTSAVVNDANHFDLDCGCAIAVRSDGDLIAIFPDIQSNMGTNYLRVSYSINTGSGWGTAADFSDFTKNAIDYICPVGCMADGDLFHGFQRGDNSAVQNLMHRHITSADSLGTLTDTGFDCQNSLGGLSTPVAFDRGGTEKLVLLYLSTTGADLHQLQVDSSTSITWSGSDTTITSVDVRSSDGRAISLSVHEETVYAVWVANGDRDIDEANDQGSNTWTTPSTIATGTFSMVAARGGDNDGPQHLCVQLSGTTEQYEDYAVSLSSTALSDLDMPTNQMRIGPIEV